MSKLSLFISTTRNIAPNIAFLSFGNRFEGDNEVSWTTAPLIAIVLVVLCV